MGKGKGGYPWWQHLKNKGGSGGGGGDNDDTPKSPKGYGKRDSFEPQSKVARTSEPNNSELSRYLQKLEGKPYGAYKDCLGEWKDCPHTIFIDKAQSDPYAPPSHFRIRVDNNTARWPKADCSDPVRNRGCCDYVTRVLNDLLRGGSGTNWTTAPPAAGWSGSKGGDIQIATCGQYILRRSAVVLTENYIEARVTLALPARGRSIEGRRAASIVSGLTELCGKYLTYGAQDQNLLII